MGSSEKWRKKYCDNVDGSLWAAIRLGFSRASGSMLGFLNRSSEACSTAIDFDLEDDLYPETILCGTARLFDYYYDPTQKKAKSIIGAEIEERYKCLIECSYAGINIKRLSDFYDDYYGESYKSDKDYMQAYGGDEIVLNELPYSFKRKLADEDDEDKRDKLEADYRKSYDFYNYHIRLGYATRMRMLRHDNKDFIDDLRDLLDKAVDNREYVVFGRIIDLCLDYVEGKIDSKSIVDGVGKELNFPALAKDYYEFEAQISDKIKGQDVAVKKFLRGLFHSQMDGEKKGPKATYLFMGPPGVGKTYLAKTAAEAMGLKCKMFQMNEYAQESSFCGLVGFESSWRNSKKGVLTSFVEENPNAVIIIDEIEKAHYNTVTQFLSILEGGFLTDLYTEKEVDFTKTIFIFTTNAGKDYYEKNRKSNLSLTPENTLLDALRNEKKPGSGRNANAESVSVLPPELISRLAKGTIVCFDYMNPVKLVPMIKNSMDEAKNTISEKLGITCEYDGSMLPYIFMYYLGAKLDARIAVDRSKAFIQDMIYSVVERMGANPEIFEGCDTGKISIQVDVEDIVSKYIEMDKKKRPVIMVVKENLYDYFKSGRNDSYKSFNAIENEDDTAEDIINHIKMIVDKNPEVESIFIDPFITVQGDEDDPDDYEGINYMKTCGNVVLQWILSQDNMPDVYVLEGKMELSPLDRREYVEKGVKEIIAIKNCFRKNTDSKAGKEKPAKFRAKINEVLYERFLMERLESLTSKGRSIDFTIGQTAKPEGTIIRIHDYKFVNNMDTDAKEVTVNSDPTGPKDALEKDVIGNDSAKEELRRFLKYLDNPKKYSRTGMKISRGMLLYGPPGTGKTLLARSLASDADCPFISVTGAQFVDGSKNIEKVFALARKYAPSIIFIDEIDAFALDRENGGYRTIINALLTEMDGFDPKSDKPVFVIAATNAASAPNLEENNIRLDEALLRRFTKKVYIDLPNKEERKAFIRMRKEQLEKAEYNLNDFTEEDIDKIANQTVGKSLDNIDVAINLAQGKAAEAEKALDMEILVDAIEEASFGEKTKISQEHLMTTAWHEAGHAIMHFVEGDEPEYATLVARGPYLGCVAPKDNERHYGYTKAELLGKIRTLLAGRAAEIVLHGPEKGLSTGASNDLERATRIAKAIICEYGMEEGFLSVMNFEAVNNSPLAPIYYEKINAILKSELDNTIAILKKKKKSLEKMATALLEKGRLTTEEMREFL